jgi:glycosyltransferase involved in cell wall biosynthesis
MPNLLAIAPYPYRSADTRYRICQFIPDLEAAGWNVTVASFMDDAFFRMYHQPGHRAEKGIRLLRSTLLRLRDVLAAGRYDTVLLHKEAFPFGPPLTEMLLRRSVRRMIYDMDDAFWSHPPQIKQIGRRLRDPERIPKMLHMVDCVLAGNDFLATYARQFNSSVVVMPTVLDLRRYYPRPVRHDDLVTIGWIGRWSSAPYLALLARVFKRLGATYPQVRFRFVGAEQDVLPELHGEVVPWRLEEEISAIEAFDIGIMPIADDMYGWGKCGFKLLQYMALGIPGVASPVGVNQTIIDHGTNGLLGDSEEEWFTALAHLIDDPALRQRIGKAGRTTVETYYSVQSVRDCMIALLSS